MVNQVSCVNAYTFLSAASKSEGGIVSPYFSALVWIVHKIHRFWLLFRFSLDYVNPAHQSLLAVGHAFHFIAGDGPWIRKTAKTLFVSRLLMEWTAMARRCAIAYRGWQRAFLLEELLLEKRQNLRSSFLSISIELALSRWEKCLRKTKDTAERFFFFLKVLFSLFVQSLDVMAAYSSCEQDLWVHSRHIFVNGYETARLFYQEFSVVVEQLKPENTTIGQLFGFFGMKKGVVGTCAHVFKKTMAIFSEPEIVKCQKFKDSWEEERKRKKKGSFRQELLFFPIHSQIANNARLDLMRIQKSSA